MITILTDPVPHGRYFLPEVFRKFYRFIRDLLKKPKYNYGYYRGHYAVTRSLIVGLKLNSLQHNYNPFKITDLADTVLVLAGVRTLLQAIELKRAGKIKRLFAGPNIVNFSTDYGSLLASPEVDGVITPSEHVNEHYIADNPSLLTRCFSWPAGVDVNYWKPTQCRLKNKVLIYEKQNKGYVGSIDPYLSYIQGRGYLCELIKYGEYNHQEYLKTLQSACLMIGFTLEESQGLAWAEAWAVDVPTLIKRNEKNVYQGRAYRTSTAPYLTANNGMFFDDFENFKVVFSYWERNLLQFSAREWVLENMSDQVCSRKLYDLLATTQRDS